MSGDVIETAAQVFQKRLCKLIIIVKSDLFIQNPPEHIRNVVKQHSEKKKSIILPDIRHLIVFVPQHILVDNEQNHCRQYTDD